ncbi:MAG: nucleotidyltransferase domain-containing protein [Chloroflexi bacterium]|nr:nucleotidyltransferase domain-containing protein [Chloroflexota bacterium]MBI3761462.1 nucleotidyltransferase domain-containing protein [Chloroflexota bacterium]
MIVQRIVEAYVPDKIILYGSYAYGMPRPDSDFDLLILKETTEPPRDRRFAVRKAIWPLPTTIPVEPLVVTESELARRLEIGDQYFQEIVSRGRTVYDRQGLARSRRMVRSRRPRLRSRRSASQRP